MMALIHFLHRNIFFEIDPEAKLFATYKWQAIKMKLSYESWARRLKLAELFKQAIFNTLVFQQSIWAYNISTFLTPKHNAQHGMN